MLPHAHSLLFFYSLVIQVFISIKHAWQQLNISLKNVSLLNGSYLANMDKTLHINARHRTSALNVSILQISIDGPLPAISVVR